MMISNKNKLGGTPCDCSAAQTSVQLRFSHVQVFNSLICIPMFTDNDPLLKSTEFLFFLFKDVEAMAKLEEKFRHKMKELADLSDEKQRLEHLVMQLQSETETIGK